MDLQGPSSRLGQQQRNLSIHEYLSANLLKSVWLISLKLIYAVGVF